jgi:osmotically-inducible protein OsmY
VLLLAALAAGPSVATAAAQAPADPEVALAVSDRLIAEPGVNGYRINVAVTDGIVDLSGTVKNVLAKERAERLSTTVKGVRAVVNRIEVMTGERSDAALQSDIESALARNPATESFEVQVGVNNGEVTLTGTVDSWQERRLAERVANGIDGVRAVNNRLDISEVPSRPDQEIEAEVAEALRWDSRIDDSAIRVEVDGGRVMLSGIVGSAAERDRATRRAWVRGVNGVSADQLEVQGWARDERFRQGKYQDLSDTSIATAVEDALSYDPRINSTQVEVSVDGGIATLTGTTPTLEGKRAAAATAHDTVGVWRVINRIKVRADAHRPDEAIAADVRETLERNPYLEPVDDIGVDVNDGVVTLKGIVSSTFERMEADYAVASIGGVLEVVNKLEVLPPDPYMAYDPYVDEGRFLYDLDWYIYPGASTATVKSDWEIVEDIRDELFWSPFVDSDDVTVAVDDGIATLTGVVDTFDERRAATENAFEGGAVAVDNDIQVVHGPAYYAP